MKFSRRYKKLDLTKGFKKGHNRLMNILKNKPKLIALSAAFLSLLLTALFFQNFTPVNKVQLADFSEELKSLKDVDTGLYHTCAQNFKNEVLCWGSNDFGQIGRPLKPLARNLNKLAEIGEVQQIGAGALFTCARTKDNSVKCWGSNDKGQMDGNSIKDALKLSVGESHACAITSNQTVKCWGDNLSWQLGANPKVQSSMITDVPDVLSARDISAGSKHTCAIVGNDKKVMCWGFNYSFYKTNKHPFELPTYVKGLSNVKKVAAGGDGFTCALLADDKVKCWGNNEHGQLGNGTKKYSQSPVLVSDISNVADISAGLTSACALINDGIVKCWGGNQYGQLGSGDTEEYLKPSVAEGIKGIAKVNIGHFHTCAINQTGSAQCWGFNQMDPLDLKSRSNSLAAVDIR